MASVRPYKNSDGSTSYVAQVRIQPFKPIAKSFPSRPAAREWADETEKPLRKQRERCADRSDLPALTVKTLIDEFLADSETKTLRYVEDLQRLCAWWVNGYRSTLVADVCGRELGAAR